MRLHISFLKYICCWSGGKDSTCSVILAHEHGLPLDYIIFSEVMFDRKKDISGENWKHLQFIKETAKPLFESWGYKVLILRAETDYLDHFYRVIERPVMHPEHRGMKFGFPAVGRCGIKRDCKEKPIKDFILSLKELVTEYVGIAIDEPKRLETLHKYPFKESILERYGYSETMALRKCREYGLVSPGYRLSKRGGCWFCPFAKAAEHKAILEQVPEVWERFVKLEEESDVAFNRWNVYAPTLKERDLEIRKMCMYEQISLMDL